MQKTHLPLNTKKKSRKTQIAILFYLERKLEKHTNNKKKRQYRKKPEAQRQNEGRFSEQKSESKKTNSS